MNVWASLARIRDISRLVLAAIERDDLQDIERLSREGGALAELVQPVLARLKDEDGTLPDDIGAQLAALSASYRAIVGGLEQRRDAVASELETVRRSRARLRSLGLSGGPEPSLVDRRT